MYIVGHFNRGPLCRSGTTVVILRDPGHGDQRLSVCELLGQHAAVPGGGGLQHTGGWRCGFVRGGGVHARCADGVRAEHAGKGTYH